MRTCYLIIVPIVLAACSSATTVIGTACKSDGDCNVAGQKCVAGLVGGMPTGAKICTHPCSGEFGSTGCPIGFDCTLSSMALGNSCNKTPYTVDAMGAPVLFGKSCKADGDCAGSGDPNAQPTCRHAEDITMPGKPLAQDPGAYCTGVCAADSDCPMTYICTTDYDNPTADPTKKKCLQRTVCDECSLNDNCPAAFPICVPTTDGKAHYCTKACAAANDCPGAPQGAAYMKCGPGADVAGNSGTFCFHAAGKCNGTGQICDPCRNQSDCTAQNIAKLRCITNSQTLERMCTKGCKVDTDCAGPNNVVCDNSDVGTMTMPGMSNLICTGDIRKTSPGVVSCHL